MAKRPLTDTPQVYSETKLYKLLSDKDKNKNTGLREKVDVLIEHVTPILNSIGSGTFHDYTLHTPVHSRKLLHLAEYIIPEETLNQLSLLELAVLIMAFYLHDIGMAVDEKRKDEILKSDDFKLFIESHKEFQDKLIALRNEIKITPDAQKPLYEEHLTQVLYTAMTSYLRPKHTDHGVYDNAMKEIELTRPDIFTYGGASFRNELITLCHSHGEDAVYLNKQDPGGERILPDGLYYKDQRLNLQYCAAILRLADILDFDAERTPSVLFRSLGIEDKKLPGFKVSLKEWKKQMSVCSIVFSDNEIEVHSHCDSPSIEKAVNEMCDTIGREIRDTSSFISRAPKDVFDIYKLSLPLQVRPVVTRIGYADKQYSIHLDESSIMTLLMGENLYDRAQVALRELLQNSIDACVLLSKLEDKYSPEISVSVSRDSDERLWIMVRDNGIGMDDNVLSNYFFNIGKSYYKSADFKTFSAKNSIRGFTPISRFGIGILSVFMIGDALKVTTQNNYSSRSDTRHRVIFIDSESLAVVHESAKREQGTTIELRLKMEQSDDKQVQRLFQYVHEVFIHPVVSIRLTDQKGNSTLIDSTAFSTVSAEKRKELMDNGVEVVEVNLNGSLVRGKANVFLFVNDDGSLSYVDKSNTLKWGQGLLRARSLMPAGNAGNRLTVNGVLMRMKKFSSILKVGKHRFYSIMDVDVEGTDDVNYNVTRTKIVGKSLGLIKEEIKKSIALEMRSRGIYDMMDEETKKLFEVEFKSC